MKLILYVFRTVEVDPMDGVPQEWGAVQAVSMEMAIALVRSHLTAIGISSTQVVISACEQSDLACVLGPARDELRPLHFQHTSAEDFDAEEASESDQEDEEAGQYVDSPEVTDIWVCLKCGNASQFIGIDANGYGGDCDECEEAGKELCDHVTELSQPLTIMRDAAGNYEGIDYHAFEGGNNNSEIGSYTSVRCAPCGALLWAETEVPA